MLSNQDSMYYRNRDIIKKMTSCSRYKSLLSYSTCTEDKVQTTKPMEREKVKEAVKATATATVSK